MSPNKRFNERFEIDAINLKWYNTARLTLGARLMVGQRTLDPYVEVRPLRPQPGKPTLGILTSLAFLLMNGHAIILSR